ncbi:glycosyltransferase family 2 protein [Microcella sp.]|uniref:glycosyltransferase family 2 protein n=1 Tax=Microcella sp. TaxID=1913979 RepID=UPI0039197A37
MSEPHPITIVVPVYGDLSSLLRCVDSLIATVDTSRDRVLLVNDSGPEADLIERELQSRISGRDGFRYARNEHNLGFVGTCNRAALELDDSGNDILLLNSDTEPLDGWIDELRAVLHDDDRHGIVCARSTNATIASLPFRLRDPGGERTRKRSEEVSIALREHLPRYSYPPVAMGFCFLVRRALIDRFGLFDEIFAPGYGEENDFCLRMADEGFRSVMAHRALVVHEGARSFLSARRARLRHEHERILTKRHPDYSARVRRYLWCDIDAADAFSDVLVGEPMRPATLFVVDDTQQLDHIALESAAVWSDVTLLAPAGLRKDLVRRALAAGVLAFGEEEGRVWDLAVTAPAAGRESRLRAQHAAPRVRTCTAGTELSPSAVAPVDIGALQRSWVLAADDMRANGVPSPLTPFLRQRVRGWAERRAPRLLRLRQLLMSRIR